MQLEECLIQAHQAIGKNSIPFVCRYLELQKNRGEYEYHICEVHEVDIIYPFDFLHN